MEKLKPWYKKKRYILSIGAIVALTLIGSEDSSNPSATSNIQSSKVYIPVVQEQIKSETAPTYNSNVTVTKDTSPNL